MPDPAVWFPAVRAGTGADVFTKRLATGLRQRGIRTEIRWLPLRAEYAPWSVRVPKPPEWATVVHVNSWLHPRFLPAHLPVVATLHHSVHHPDLEPYKGRLRGLYHQLWIRSVERRTLRRSDVVVAVSRFVADTARRTLFDRPMKVIYNGVDTERFRPSTQRLPHKPFRLLYVGSWISRKGVDLLAPIMRELGDGFELCYTGGPAAQRDRRDMPPNMRDIGRLQGDDAVVAAMQDADAFLFPSRSEGHPLVVIEAMACGVPAIATRGSSLVEVVEDGLNGTLCRRDDVTAFAEAARNTACDIDTYEQLRSHARTLVCSRFSVDAMIADYVKCYVTCTTGTTYQKKLPKRP